MRLIGILHDLIDCLGSQGDYLLGWDEAQHWPNGAIVILEECGLIKETEPARTFVCRKCGEECECEVHYRAGPTGEPQPVIACNERSDMGVMHVPTKALRQWKVNAKSLASWLANAIGVVCIPKIDRRNGYIHIGRFKSVNQMIDVGLLLDDPLTLDIAGHDIALRDLVTDQNGILGINQESFSELAALPPKKRPRKRKPTKLGDGTSGNNGNKHPALGSQEWRTATARKAANARHDKPGGSREKQEAIRAIWASGKYTTRDRCAEEECAALDMSFSAARKALRNTPDPKPST